MATRLRKTCPDCGTRGNWRLKIHPDTCPECTSTRLRHAAIRKEFYDRCARRPADPTMCHPTTPPMCSSCTEYFASPTHAFFMSRPG